MMRDEFDTKMEARFGWTFPAENYSRVEEAYMATDMSKDAFVEYCGIHDMNGVEKLCGNSPQSADVGTTTKSEPAKFEFAERYSTTSICDHECVFTIRIVKRTAKTVTFTQYGKERRTKIHYDDNGDEYIMPDNYSMCPVYRAKDKK
jgi:hypothetical protein